MSEQPLKRDPIQGDIVHEYDGIEEADNALPVWWLATFFITVVFGLAYWRVSPSTRQEYVAEMAAHLSEGGEVTEEGLVMLSEDPATVELGQQTFHTNCVVCHGEHAEGNIGPNLTDDHWIHGGAATNIYSTVTSGVATAGMPQWGPVLGDRTVRALVAYVLTLRDTNVPGRPPQGELYVPSAAPTPAATDAPTPAAAEAPTPAAVEAPTTAAAEAPTPAAAEAPTAVAAAPTAATITPSP